MFLGNYKLQLFALHAINLICETRANAAAGGVDDGAIVSHPGQEYYSAEIHRRLEEMVEKEADE